eukprot:TRINITY_DN14091_c0_g1_i2.p1 TRINITY_DN14091_c0_g1~~TRINITY_DN14091_c0_g1_i2.p1  ORF type:complete len:1199 (+),score=298.65 TRINITY_DN14091_c0_g1_i2:52-3597(+)
MPFSAHTPGQQSVAVRDDKSNVTVFTSLVLTPSVAAAEHPVNVQWHVGADVRWAPTGDDEVRVFNTKGVLFSKLHFWDCTPKHPTEGYKQGEGTLIAPAADGSYVVCLYDFASKRRMFSATFRVAASKVGLPYDVVIKQAETPPAGRLDVTYNPSQLYGGFLGIFRFRDEDNSGLNAPNASPFGSALVTVNAPTPDLVDDPSGLTTLAFVTPEEEGDYVVRYMKNTRAGVLRSIALSSTFTVRGTQDGESLDAITVRGSLSLPGAPTTGVRVGATLTVEWNITDGFPVLSELDCIFLYPYGRPEAVRQGDDMGTVTTARLAKWRAEVVAPLDAGRYEVGYYSHRLQKFIVDGPSLLVAGECATFTVLPEDLRTPVGGRARICWAIDDVVFDSQDRYRIYDESMNLYGSLPITGILGYADDDDVAETEGGTGGSLSAAYRTLFGGRLKGVLSLTFDRPGKYIAAYWSRRLGREVARTEPLRVVAPPGGRYPVKDIRVDITARLRQAPSKHLRVMYAVSGCEGAGGCDRHCIAVYRRGDRDYVPTQHFDTATAMPALSTFWLAGRDAGDIEFAPLQEPGEYEVRYLTPTGHGTWLAVALCAFRCVSRDEEHVGAGLVDEPLDQLPVRELAEVTCCLFADDGEGALAQGQDEASSPIQGRRAVEAVAAQRRDETILHQDSQTEFRGSVMVPKSVPLKEPVVVTFHVMAGQPLPNDRIVLVDEMCTDVLSEAALEHCIGRSDLTLGTLMLRPPPRKGLYQARYFSSKHRSLVLESPLFRIVDESTNEQQPSPDAADQQQQEAEAVSEALAAARRRVGDLPTSLSGPLTVETVDRPVQRRQGRLRCALVGASYLGCRFSLRGTTHDVEIMQKCLMQHFPQADPSDVLVLSESGAADAHSRPTAYNIRRALRWLLEGCQPKDHLLFYFAGLGSQLNSYGSDETEGHDMCLLPIDYDWRDRCIRFQELRDDLYLRAPRGTNVTVVLDCGHVPNTLDTAVQRGVFDETEIAGAQSAHLGAQRLCQRRQKRGWDDRVISRCLVPPQGTFHSFCGPKRAWSKRTEPPVTAHTEGLGGLATLLQQVDAAGGQVHGGHSGMWLIQGCRGDEMCTEKFLDGVYQGLFTWAFAEAIARCKSATSPRSPLWYKVVLDATHRVLRRWPYQQTPRLCCADAGDLYGAMLDVPGGSHGT